MEAFSISVPMSAAGVSLLTASAAELARIVKAPVAAAAAASAVAAPAAAPAVAAGAVQERKKPGRKSNAEKAAMAAAAAQQGASAAGADDLDLDTDDDGDDDELGLGDTTPAKKYTLTDDVIPAFRSALERVGGDKSKLAAVLASYNVKSVQQLPEASFGEVIAKLAKLK